MEIRRDITDTLRRWKEETDGRPILLKGVRQIGKAWAMEMFGKGKFDYCAKFDFDRQSELRPAFQAFKSPERILKELSLYTEVPIVAGKTLIILDEIQECEEALNNLEYFYEDAPACHIITVGSLLGVAVKRRSMTVPIGKVGIMRMYPITFREFLRAANERTFSYVENLHDASHLPEIVLDKSRTEYRRYLACDGMPEAAISLLGNKGMEAVEKVQQDILDLYELGSAKYATPREIPCIHATWHSLLSQFVKENRKFILKIAKPGVRSKDYEDALLWLEDVGVIYRVFNITKPGFSISVYTDPSAFRVYACDCRLLRRLVRLPVTVILNASANYIEFKGSMAENVILQSLMPLLNDDVPYYWSLDSRTEIGLAIQWGERIIPIEAKAENCVSGRSLPVYNERYHPQERIRFSFPNLQYNEGSFSCPLPLADWFYRLLPNEQEAEFCPHFREVMTIKR